MQRSYSQTLAMAFLIQEIAKQAEITFSKNITDESFSDNLSELITLINGLQASDLNINLDTEQIDSSAENTVKSSEPITGSLIYKNELFEMVIYVLQNGSNIPLHDHPQMHSVLKIVLGTVKMSVYSPVSKHIHETKIADEFRNRRMNNPTDTLVPVELHMSKNITNKDEPVVVTPTVGNYHAMSAVEGPAVIFEILAPPYDLITRNCHYYSILESKDSNLQCKTWLYEIAADLEYWMVSGKYTGPQVTL